MKHHRITLSFVVVTLVTLHAGCAAPTDGPPASAPEVGTSSVSAQFRDGYARTTMTAPGILTTVLHDASRTREIGTQTWDVAAGVVRWRAPGAAVVVTDKPKESPTLAAANVRAYNEWHLSTTKTPTLKTADGPGCVCLQWITECIPNDPSAMMKCRARSSACWTPKGSTAARIPHAPRRPCAATSIATRLAPTLTARGTPKNFTEPQAERA
jgi:hypothetical protein